MTRRHERSLLVLVLVVLAVIAQAGSFVSAQETARQDPPPFFAVGLYAVDWARPYRVDVTREFPDIAAAGFNLIHAYEFESDSPTAIEDATAYLNAAQRSGLQVLMGIPRACVVNGDVAGIRRRVAALQDHEALFGWQLFDEPDTPVENPAIRPERLEEAYRAIKGLDPIRPVTIASFRLLDDAYPFANGFDTFMSAYLPLPAEPFSTPVSPITDAAVRVLTPQGKAVIQHVLVYNITNDSLIWPDWPETLKAYPTREEIRFTSYYAIVRGATGIIFNCYRFDYGDDAGRDDVSRMNNPAQWRVVSSVAAELRSMVPIFLAPGQSLHDAGVRIMGATAITMMIKQHQGRTYLLTVNPTPDPVRLPIRLAPDRFTNPTITLLPERQSVPFRDGSFEAEWGPYDVRVYEVTEHRAPDGQQFKRTTSNTSRDRGRSSLPKN